MAIFFRSLIFNILFYIWTFCITFFCLPVLFLNRKFVVKIWFFWIKITSKFLKTFVGVDYEIVGSENISTNNVIYACQHQSAWDTIIIPYLIGDCIIFHKKSLLFIPLFGWYLFKLGMVIITRNKGANNLKKIIHKTKEAINKKRSVLIFPHGTRTLPNSKNKIQSGVAILYKHLNTKVVPVKLNSGTYWGRNKFIKKPGKITVNFLKPIKPGLKPGEFRNVLEKIL
tara:strand:- start:53 stop:733 length:681 start_codon:yes stop_codon:yes gene_type:complete